MRFREKLLFYSYYLKNKNKFKGIRVPKPFYSDIARKLSVRIPKEQKLIIFIDENEKSYKLVVENGKPIRANEFIKSGNELRALVFKYLNRLRLGFDVRNLHDELNWIYRTLLPLHITKNVYIWLEGIHSFTPFNYQRGDKIFQVLDLGTLANQKAFQVEKMFPPGFKIRKLGANTAKRTCNHTWERRLFKMDSVILGAQTSSYQSPLHLYSPILLHPSFTRRNLKRFLKQKNVWLVSPFSFSKTPDTELDNFHYVFFILSRTKSPGVIFLRRPLLTAYPEFLKNYYNRNNPFYKITTRFTEAYSRLSSLYGDPSYYYGIRLVTPVFVE